MSPILYLDLNILASQYKKFRQALPEFRIFYALKANPHPEVVQKLKELNASFETASWEEIKFLQEEGVSPQNIIFSNPVKPADSIYKAVSNKVDKFVIDSKEELDKFRDIATNTKLFLRIAVSNKGSRWA